MRPTNFLFLFILFLSLNAWSYQFGYDGRNGTRGREGRDGMSGRPVVLKATGQALSLDLRGQDGEDGSSGDRGDNAGNCYQPYQVAYNLYGADGGDGGDAGRGGDGGRAGDVTIFTNDLANLSKILVYATGGRGGRGGYAGDGGYGCACQRHSWTIRSCHMEKQPDGSMKEVCYNNTYYCRDGDNGRRGNSTSDYGSNGRSGTLFVIPQLDALPTADPEKRIKMGDMLAGTFVLSDQLWSSHGGAEQILAPGSQLSNIYYKYERLVSFNQRFVWSVRRPLSDFRGVPMVLKASAEGGGVYVNISNDVWYEAEDSQDNGVFVTDFKKALYETEAFKFSFVAKGQKADLVAELDDVAGVSDMLNTQFYLTFKRDKFINKTLFQGVMPPDLVVAQGNKFILKLGQLPGLDMDDIKAGRTLIVNLKVTRSLSHFSGTQEIEKTFKVSK